MKQHIKVTKNFYFIATVVFLVWMLFFDSNDFYSQYQLKSKVEELEDQKAYYQKKIERTEADREALLNDDELLEKFAREKYFMKKDGEDVFVVIEE
ncbi:FtsB family cell division protein [Reichenbachiella agariperforans]|uniref:Cell division protein FtsB n=1 Tax=Reichenbachiella agariperforans TaxID=156994 RepID=A0A1M6Q963_REIAG|nr:septum formation initiator family protein [Reichenbachiella agariperforans]MBU2914270.1 septum formation initiator family protein [Reichenbachiella agariperforans]SHK16623.1 Cell division protein FtsB [Reichenbachiella agariperforans]